MVDDTWVRLTLSYSHLQCLKRKCGVDAGGDSIANYPPGVGIQYRRQIDKTSSDADISDVGNLYLIQPIDNHFLDEIGIPGKAARRSLSRINRSTFL